MHTCFCLFLLASDILHVDNTSILRAKHLSDPLCYCVVIFIARSDHEGKVYSTAVTGCIVTSTPLAGYERKDDPPFGWIRSDDG